ncbi:MAG: hypothetical protein RM368_33615 [Nostoc sp. DedSLP03]|uniref:hypothetical protein n=1 Tax=Nostoc sp. DedSLP03 TaxID=3075400 RepID=UPI002AD28025|nr:hypothetical protein [Nostoc sp. DedSLP03]MDZ7969825.1 hypothetical protein [Nostoc sp. DedSLP03]
MRNIILRNKPSNSVIVLILKIVFEFSSPKTIKVDGKSFRFPLPAFINLGKVKEFLIFQPTKN